MQAGRIKGKVLNTDSCQEIRDTFPGFLQCFVVLSVEGTVNVRVWKLKKEKKKRGWVRFEKNYHSYLAAALQCERSSDIDMASVTGGKETVLIAVVEVVVSR